MKLILLGLGALGAGVITYFIGRFIGLGQGAQGGSTQQRAKDEIARVREDAKRGDDGAVLGDFRRAADRRKKPRPAKPGGQFPWQ